MVKTASSEALARALERNDETAEMIRARFHRTMLWRLATGLRRPNLRTAVELEKLTRRRVSCAGWFRTAK